MKLSNKLMAALLAAAMFPLAACSSAPAETTKEPAKQEEQNTPEEKDASDSTKATESTEEGPKYEVTMKIKDHGDIIFEMTTGTAPETVQNFVNLAEGGFYDGLTFHRIIDGFMIQGGDPAGNGSGGSSKQIEGEFASNGFKNSLKHKRGTVSMARATTDPNSASSQFFIMHEDNESLDGQYAAFGTVISGMDIVDELAKTPVTDGNGSVDPDDQPIIESVTVKEIE